ncbi:MAG: type VI secretion system protein TssA [Propionivibrio sp.]
MSQPIPNSLMEPIPGDDICGTDLSFSGVFDEIREARRQDDPTLAQGDWTAALKTAQWPRIKELAEDILRHRSKDMQVAAWYTEAMTRLAGFDGLVQGLLVMDSLVNDFWEFCYPSFDPEDLDERAGKIEWLNNQMPFVVREIPLTDQGSGAYSWLAWEESRRIDNLGLKDPSAREQAVASGKLSGEHFDKAVQISGRTYYEKLHERIKSARVAATTLARRIDDRFGADAPSLKDLLHAIHCCDELVGKLLARFGGVVPATTKSASPTSSISDQSGERAQQMSRNTAIGEASPMNVGLIINRDDAIRALREVACYFRQHEPHSPVALLAERAANWAEMPLEKWLAAVIKDQSTLGQLRELLDIKETIAS